MGRRMRHRIFKFSVTLNSARHMDASYFSIHQQRSCSIGNVQQVSAQSGNIKNWTPSFDIYMQFDAMNMQATGGSLTESISSHSMCVTTLRLRLECINPCI